MKQFSSLLISLVFATVAHAGTPWTQLHGSASHVGTWNGAIDPAAVQFDWSSSANLFLNRSSQPVLSTSADKIFAYSDLSTHSGAIYAFSTADGSQLWSANVRSRVDLWSASSPAYQNGYVYWAGSDHTGKFSIYKLSETNGSATVWSYDNYLGEIVNDSLTIAGGKLFVSTYGATDSNYSAYSARHYAINLADGQIAWSNTDGGQGQGSMAYDPSRNQVYQTVLQGGQHKVRAYNAGTGAVAWTSSWASQYPFHQDGIAYDAQTDALYLQDYNFNGDGWVYKVAASNGVKTWQAATPRSGTGVPTVDIDGTIYTCGDYGNFVDPGRTRAYAPNGQVDWTVSLAGGWIGSTAWADGYVLVGDQYGDNFYLLNELNGGVVSTLAGSGPAVFGTDHFYTVGSNGRLYAYYAGAQPSIPGDTNRDGDVDLADLGNLAGNYGATSGKAWEQGDFDGDGDVDLVDLGALAGNYGIGVPAPLLDFAKDAASVGLPEPTIVMFLGFGALSLCARRKTVRS